MTRRTYRLLGIPVWTVETDEEVLPDKRGSVVSEGHEFGFVLSDDPTWHKPWERPGARTLREDRHSGAAQAAGGGN